MAFVVVVVGPVVFFVVLSPEKESVAAGKVIVA
jgi:hypothetical protein